MSRVTRGSYGDTLLNPEISGVACAYAARFPERAPGRDGLRGVFAFALVLTSCASISMRIGRCVGMLAFAGSGRGGGGAVWGASNPR
ncbi:MAG: hypothetical protein ACLPKT_10365 [Methylocella sp.]